MFIIIRINERDEFVQFFELFWPNKIHVVILVLSTCRHRDLWNAVQRSLLSGDELFPDTK